MRDGCGRCRTTADTDSAGTLSANYTIVCDVAADYRILLSPKLQQSISDYCIADRFRLVI